VRDLPPGAVGQAHELPGPAGQGASPGGEADAAAGAQEERVAEVGAQRRHGGRDRRLAHAEGVRGGPEGAQLGDEREGAELGERHRRTALISDRLSAC
jgi:hypothetical protein